MIEQQQHCEHECVCKFVILIDGKPCSGANCRSRGRGEYDARTQPNIGSIRQPILQEDAYLIERVNAGMGEWEYVIQYCGEWYATVPSEEIAREIVRRAVGGNPDIDVIHELRNALFAAANRYHQLRGITERYLNNELQFRSVVEFALKKSEGYKASHEGSDPLDWRRRNE